MLDDCGYGTADLTHSHTPLHVYILLLVTDAPPPKKRATMNEAATKGRGSFTQSRGRAVCLLSFRSKFSVKVLLREAIATVVILGPVLLPYGTSFSSKSRLSIH